jgi:hypothetical protein
MLARYLKANGRHWHTTATDCSGRGDAVADDAHAAVPAEHCCCCCFDVAKIEMIPFSRFFFVFCVVLCAEAFATGIVFSFLVLIGYLILLGK